jgi:hypothetical protein
VLIETVPKKNQKRLWKMENQSYFNDPLLNSSLNRPIIA